MFKHEGGCEGAANSLTRECMKRKPRQIEEGVGCACFVSVRQHAVTCCVQERRQVARLAAVWRENREAYEKVQCCYRLAFYSPNTFNCSKFLSTRRKIFTKKSSKFVVLGFESASRWYNSIMSVIPYDAVRLSTPSSARSGSTVVSCCKRNRER